MIPLDAGGLVALAVLLALGGTAAWDARTGRIPDIPLALAAVPAVAWRVWLGDWRTVALAAGIGFALWAINEVWYRLSGRDAFGMGDAKWTALAALGFGAVAALAAWLVGAWLGLLWMGSARLLGRRLGHVHFAPFLFLGLLLALAWPALSGTVAAVLR